MQNISFQALRIISILMTMLFPFQIKALSVEKPVLSHISGTYHAPITVTISCATPEAILYYTVDGTTPTQESRRYNGAPILVANHATGNILTDQCDNDPDSQDDNAPLSFSSLTLKAIAVKEGMENSSVIEAVYVIDLVEASFNIAYDVPPDSGGGKHWLDVYHPVGKSGTPVIMFVHGGAWKQGDKNIYLELGNVFAGYYGLTTVIINYQLSADPWNAVHPTHIQDVAKAFAWIKNNIEAFGGNADNISIFGQSAGAHLVSLLATDESYLAHLGLNVEDIQQVIAMSGAYDLYDLVCWPNNPLNLSTIEVLEYKSLCLNTFGSWEEEVLNAASPGEFVNIDQPPVHLIALNETETFKDMPGFGADADHFYQQIIDLNAPIVTLDRISESDIDPQILALDFPGNTDGHYHEIYAINTQLWNSRSAKMVAEFVGNYPEAVMLISPPNGSVYSEDSIVLEWTESSNAFFYQLQISESDGFQSENMVWNGEIGQSKWLFSNLCKGIDYYWRVRAVNGLGESEWSETGMFTVADASCIASSRSGSQSFALSSFPNPFNAAVMLQITVPHILTGSACLTVYNSEGSLVDRRLLELHQGIQRVLWSPHDKLASGILFFRICYGSFSANSEALYIK